jgi:CTP synthase (UTP-ammonia lyase)
MGITDADSAEHAGESTNLIIAPVACPVPNRRDGAPKLSGSCRLMIQPATRLSGVYRAREVQEQYFCNYEVNPAYYEDFRRSGLALTAFDETGALRAAELPDRRFFVATLFQPQLSSSEGAPHPLIVEFLAAAADGPARPS